MGILVECPKCKVRGSVKRKVCKCGNQVQKSDSKNYWIEYYLEGKRTRERIGRSKQAAENRLREVQTAKAEGRNIKKNKNAITTALKVTFCKAFKLLWSKFVPFINSFIIFDLLHYIQQLQPIF